MEGYGDLLLLLVTGLFCPTGSNVSQGVPPICIWFFQLAYTDLLSGEHFKWMCSIFLRPSGIFAMIQEQLNSILESF